MIPSKRSLLWWSSLVNICLMIAIYFVEQSIGERTGVTTLITYMPQHVFGIPLVLLILCSLALRDWRSLAYNIAGAMFFAVNIMGFNIPVSSYEGISGQHLRVMAYNIHHASCGVDAVAKTIKEMDPDVLCVQEANAAGRLSDPMPELKRRMSGWEVSRHGELAIFSRFPIASSTVTPLMPKTTRTALCSVISVDHRTVTIINAHLNTATTATSITDRSTRVRKYLVQTARVRGIQVDRLLEIAAKMKTPVIVAGDFNNPPRGRLYARIVHSFQDAFQRAGLGFGYTYTFRSYGPVMRIDYIFAGRDFRVRDCLVPRSHSSDHRPVVSDLVLPD